MNKERIEVLDSLSTSCIQKHVLINEPMLQKQQHFYTCENGRDWFEGSWGVNISQVWSIFHMQRFLTPSWHSFFPLKAQNPTQQERTEIICFLQNRKVKLKKLNYSLKWIFIQYIHRYSTVTDLWGHVFYRQHSVWTPTGLISLFFTMILH